MRSRLLDQREPTGLSGLPPIHPCKGWCGECTSNVRTSTARQRGGDENVSDSSLGRPATSLVDSGAATLYLAQGGPSIRGHGRGRQLDPSSTNRPIHCVYEGAHTDRAVLLSNDSQSSSCAVRLQLPLLRLVTSLYLYDVAPAAVDQRTSRRSSPVSSSALGHQPLNLGHGRFEWINDGPGNATHASDP